MAIQSNPDVRYRFRFNTYFKDDTGYCVITEPHAPISVIADNKANALKKVFAAFEGVEYKGRWSLRASIQDVEEIDPVTVKEGE